MSGNQIDFSYALWATPQAIAMLQQGSMTYVVAYHDDEHCTLLVQEGQAAPTSSTLSLDTCEDYLAERKLLRGWQSGYPAFWPTGKLENQKSGGKLETPVGGMQ